jgi:hypothetical protein
MADCLEGPHFKVAMLPTFKVCISALIYNFKSKKRRVKCEDITRFSPLAFRDGIERVVSGLGV